MPWPFYCYLLTPRHRDSKKIKIGNSQLPTIAKWILFRRMEAHMFLGLVFAVNRTPKTLVSNSDLLKDKFPAAQRAQHLTAPCCGLSLEFKS